MNLSVKRRTFSCSSEDGHDDLGGGFLYRKQRLLFIWIACGMGRKERLLLSNEALLPATGSRNTRMAGRWDVRKESLDDLHDDYGNEQWKVKMKSTSREMNEERWSVVTRRESRIRNPGEADWCYTK